jgi:hypothetical protein
MHRSTALRPRYLARLSGWRGLVAAGGDDRLDPAAAEPGPDPRVAVPLVAGDRVRAFASAPAAHLDGVHQRLEAQRLVALPRGGQRAQGHAAAVGHKMKLRAKASAGSSQGVVVRLAGPVFFEAPAAERWARMLDPSTSKTLQSIRPCSSRKERLGRARRAQPDRDLREPLKASRIPLVRMCAGFSGVGQALRREPISVDSDQARLIQLYLAHVQLIQPQDRQERRPGLLGCRRAEQHWDLRGHLRRQRHPHTGRSNSAESLGLAGVRGIGQAAEPPVVPADQLLHGPARTAPNAAAMPGASIPCMARITARRRMASLVRLSLRSSE